ncbi:MAG: precorrin-2 C(20)-methyltransferase [Deltaproteobacteria bacterium]|jgi:precorrin-2/cobalt-factor-2 C20-methyltransferase|nr:precorrin-2 C(20)-methyltransferase [Deltaproteobacteria bacterium]
MQKYGTLYGIGVGPGDPDLLTLRAVKILSGIDVLFAPSSSKNSYSIALNIVAGHLPKDVRVMRLSFPMSREEATLQKARAENVRKIASVLEQGWNAACITLGDPLIFSTFGYISTALAQNFPQIKMEIVPGITSFQAAAAKTATILCEKHENLLIIPGIKDKTALDQDLSLADNAVILKAGGRLADIKASLNEAREKNARLQTVFISRVGLEHEIICRNLDEAPEKPGYLSLILATKKRASE